MLAAGLTVGDPVLRTGNPLSVELGPGKYSAKKVDTPTRHLVSFPKINYNWECRHPGNYL